MNLLEKGVWDGQPRLAHNIAQLQVEKATGIYYLNHARVGVNDRTDRRTSVVEITMYQQLCRTEVLRGLRNFLSRDKPQHQLVGWLLNVPATC